MQFHRTRLIGNPDAPEVQHCPICDKRQGDFNGPCPECWEEIEWTRENRTVPAWVADMDDPNSTVPGQHRS